MRTEINSPREGARTYLAHAWSPIPVPFKTKKPNLDGWPNLRLTQADIPNYFDGQPQNIGVLLGEASGGLISITSSMPTGDNHGVKVSKIPGHRQYNRKGGRPGLTVDFKMVCDATFMARNGSGKTITDIANRFGVSRGWIHKWVYLVLDA